MRAIPPQAMLASNFGEILLSPIHSARSFCRPTAKKRKFSLWNAIRQKAKIPAAIGPSCATAESTLINPSSIAGSANDFLGPSNLRELCDLCVKFCFLLRLMPKSPNSCTPHALHFHMAAEWELHEGTFLGWPHELTDWPGKFAPIPWAFAEIIRHLARVEHVFLLVESAAAASRVKSILKKSHANLGNVHFLRVPTDRGWMRDSGPICVTNTAGEVAFNHFLFNGWAKYSNHKKDAQ